MVFVPTHQTPAEPHEAAATPKRPDHAHIPTSATSERHQWRAVVHSTGDVSVTTSWHLATCSAPVDPAAHCPEGQNLIAAHNDPDGHCLVDGRCARCEAA